MVQKAPKRGGRERGVRARGGGGAERDLGVLGHGQGEPLRDDEDGIVRAGLGRLEGLDLLDLLGLDRPQPVDREIVLVEELHGLDVEAPVIQMQHRALGGKHPVLNVRFPD